MVLSGLATEVWEDFWYLKQSLRKQAKLKWLAWAMFFNSNCKLYLFDIANAAEDFWGEESRGHLKKHICLMFNFLRQFKRYI